MVDSGKHMNLKNSSVWVQGPSQGHPSHQHCATLAISPAWKDVPSTAAMTCPELEKLLP